MASTAAPGYERGYLGGRVYNADSGRTWAWSSRCLNQAPAGLASDRLRADAPTGFEPTPRLHRRDATRPHPTGLDASDLDRPVWIHPH